MRNGIALLAVCACHAPPREAPPPAATTLAQTAPARAPDAAPVPWAGDDDDTWRGALEGPLAITMHLERHGASLRGEYFYDDRGRTLALAGTVEPDGTFVLTENAGHGSTGRFEGHADARALTGRWIGPGDYPSARRFTLTRVGRSSLLLAFLRHARSQRRANAASLSGLQTTCDVDVEYVSVAGSRDAAIDRALNAQLAPTGLGEPCEEPYVRTAKAEINVRDAAILAVVYHETYDGGAYPSSSRRFVNLDVQAGVRIRLDALFPDRKRLARVVNPRFTKVRSAALGGEPIGDVGGDELAKLTRADADYGVESRGLRFTLFNQEPHAAQAAFDEGVLVPWSVLAPLLAPSHPLGALVLPRR